MNLGDYLRAPFAILAGAGISYASPSSLPRAFDILETIIKALPMLHSDQQELLDSTSPTWAEGIGYCHFLRFEQLVESLQLTIDPRLSFLSRILPDTTPNEYHYILASLLRAGFPILTTNFDCLIEKACHDCDIAVTVISSRDDYAQYRKRPARVKNPLFKLHGTLQPPSNGTQSSLDVRIRDVTSQFTAAPEKWSIISELLSRHDLLVIGYSGSDDFDVMPVVNHAKGARRLCWVSHSSATADVFRDIRGARSLLNHPDPKLAWFFRQMFLSLNAQFGGVTREEKGVVAITGDTAVLLAGAAAARKIKWRNPPVQHTPSPRFDVVKLRSEVVSSGNATLLLAARLMQLVGRYEKAIDYLHGF